MTGRSTNFPIKVAVFPFAADWHCIGELNKVATPQRKMQYCF